METFLTILYLATLITLVVSQYMTTIVNNEAKKFREDLSKGRLPIYLSEKGEINFIKEIQSKLNDNTVDKRAIYMIKQSEADDIQELIRKLKDSYHNSND